jgi:hypothetical protein
LFRLLRLLLPALKALEDRPHRAPLVHAPWFDVHEILLPRYYHNPSSRMVVK